MSGKNLATFGIYSDQVTACEAVDALKRIGFRPTDTSTFVQENFGSKDMGHEKHTKAPEGAAAGTIIGGILGGALGWMLAAGTLGTIPPWMMRFTGVEPIGTTLIGVAAGMMLGVLIGAVSGLSVPVYEAKRYAGRIRNGGILVSVHCDNVDWTKRAKDVMRATGARDIGVLEETRADFGVSEKPLPRTRATTIVANTTPSIISVDPIAPELDVTEKIASEEMVRSHKD